MSRKRLIIGQRSQHIPAGTINGIMDDADRLASQIGFPPGVARLATVDGSPCLVYLALNTSSADLVERAPGAVKQSAFELPDLDPDTDGGDVAPAVILGPPAIEIGTPDDATTNWVITLGPIKQNETGLVVIMGLVACRVDVTDATHKFATIKSDDTKYLKSDTAGAAIWDRKKKDVAEDPGADPPTTPKGKQWAYVLIGGTGGGGTSTVAGQVYQVVAPVSKATGTRLLHWGSGTGYLVDDSTGIPNTDVEIPLLNRFYVAYPAGCEVIDFGNGKLVGPCGPAPPDFWDDGDE